MCGRNFFAFRLWRCSGQPCNNQQSYGPMNVTVVSSRSERSRNNLGRNSNRSGRMFSSREKWIGLDQNTLPPMAPVFLHISRKLLSVLLAEQHGVCCHRFPGLCVRKCGNRGAVVVVVQTPIEAVMHPDAISKIQYMVLWQFKRWFLLTVLLSVSTSYDPASVLLTLLR
jgi:hypothetical protein